jgi:hypothetical protein
MATQISQNAWAKFNDIMGRLDKVAARQAAFAARCDKIQREIQALPPSAAQYRIDPSLIVEGRCCARRAVEPSEALDVWQPKAYAEGVCGKPIFGHTGLCASCHRIEQVETEEGVCRRWHGRITEDIRAGSHIYGSAWSAKCKFKAQA